MGPNQVGDGSKAEQGEDEIDEIARKDAEHHREGRAEAAAEARATTAATPGPGTMTAMA